MGKPTTANDDDSSTVDFYDKQRTEQQVRERRQISDACMVEESTLSEEIHVINGDFADKSTSIDKLRKQFDSVDLIEKMQKNIIRIDEMNASDIDGTVTHSRGPCIDVNAVYRKDQDGDTLLHIAIISLAQYLVFDLINKTPCSTWLNIQNKLLQTPLHLAVLTNQVSLIRRLVVAGADTVSRDKEGNMAIHLGCRNNSLDILRALLEPVTNEEQKTNNYDIAVQNLPYIVNSKNYDGYTCLHIASSFGHIDIVKTLIENNADINVRAEKSGRTILHDAAWSGNINMVRWIVSLGKRCDINAKTYDGYTAFDLARSRGHWSIVIELATAGAKNDEGMEQ